MFLGYFCGENKETKKVYRTVPIAQGKQKWDITAG